jgi:hypothetical protein
MPPPNSTFWCNSGTGSCYNYISTTAAYNTTLCSSRGGYMVRARLMSVEVCCAALPRTAGRRGSFSCWPPPLVADWALLGPLPQLVYSSQAEQAMVENSIKALGNALPADYWLGYSFADYYWSAVDGSGHTGPGSPSTNTSSDWYHWGSGNADTMTANPGYTCARASSSVAYTYFWGNPVNYADLKNATLFFSNTSTNTHGWCVPDRPTATSTALHVRIKRMMLLACRMASSCTSLYAFVCEYSLASFSCPAAPPPAPPPPATLAPTCRRPELLGS